MVQQSINSAFIYPKWPVSNVLAFSTTKKNPIKSKRMNNSYDDFNLGLHVGDSPERVNNNRNALIRFFPPTTAIQWLDQVHGNHVINIESVSNEAITADAVITRKKNIALAIMTADCLPIILADINGKEIAVIHAGWRPLASNIILQTVKKMQTKPTEICAWLGPCISQRAFEVGAEVKQIFCELSPNNDQAFIAHQQNKHKYFANLHQIAENQLMSLNINCISTVDDCTFENKSQYYSYRRNPTTGRMATLAALL